MFLIESLSDIESSFIRDFTVMDVSPLQIPHTVFLAGKERCYRTYESIPNESK